MIFIYHGSLKFFVEFKTILRDLKFLSTSEMWSFLLQWAQRFTGVGLINCLYFRRDIKLIPKQDSAPCIGDKDLEELLR